jgi:hypothetical protein
MFRGMACKALPYRQRPGVCGKGSMSRTGVVLARSVQGQRVIARAPRIPDTRVSLKHECGHAELLQARGDLDTRLPGPDYEHCLALAQNTE